MATGLVYMQARYNDPAIGRFLSSDPVGFAQGGPGYSNRYAYVMNDPVNHTDPTGMCPRCLAAAGRVGVRTVRYGGNVGRATRETMNEIRHDAGMLVAADSSGAQRAAALFNLASPVSTRDLQAVGNWVFNESAEGEVEPQPVNPPNVEDFKDPDNIPDGWEWRGRGREGGREGAWVNPETGEAIHDDRTHPQGKDPHWTYTDERRRRWDTFDDGETWAPQ